MGDGTAPLGVVLAGGASRRTGVAKATVAVPGGLLIERPLSALAAAGLEAVVVAKRGSSLPALTVPLWSEPDAPRHPLGGIVAALERHGGPVVVLAFDAPFVPASLVALLADTPGAAVVPEHAGTLEPLVARYEPAALPTLRRASTGALALRAAVRELDAVILGEAALRRHGDPARMFANVNRPEDLG